MIAVEASPKQIQEPEDFEDAPECVVNAVYMQDIRINPLGKKRLPTREEAAARRTAPDEPKNYRFIGYAQRPLDVDLQEQWAAFCARPVKESFVQWLNAAGVQMIDFEEPDIVPEGFNVYLDLAD